MRRTDIRNTRTLAGSLIPLVAHELHPWWLTVTELDTGIFKCAA